VDGRALVLVGLDLSFVEGWRGGARRRAAQAARSDRAAASGRGADGTSVRGLRRPLMGLALLPIVLSTALIIWRTL